MRLPRGEHPAPGRAPGDRDDDGRRPRQAAAALWPRASCSTASRRRRSATPSRPASTPRTPAGLHAGARRDRPPRVRPRSGRPDRHRCRRRRRHPSRSTTPWSPRSSPGVVTRDEARVRLMRSLEQTAVTVRGGTTNKSFLLDSSTGTSSSRATADTTWLDRLTAAGEHLHHRARRGGAVVSAAIEAWDAEMALERATLLRLGVARPPADRSYARRAASTAGSRATATSSRSEPISPDRYRVVVDGIELDARGRAPAGARPPARPSGAAPTGSGRASTASSTSSRSTASPTASRRDSGGVVRRPAPALVVSVSVAPGAQVEKGQVLAVLESMKMENPVLSPVAGRVRAVHVVANTQVDAGATAGAARSGRGRRRARRHVSTASTSASSRHRSRDDDARARCLAALDAMRRQVLGFDDDDAGTTLDTYRKSRTRSTRSRPASSSVPSCAVLEAFADTTALAATGPRTSPEPTSSGRPEQYFHRYLRGLDVDAEDLPDSFRAKLQRAVRHFGITDLDRQRGARAGRPRHLPGPAARRRAPPDRGGDARPAAHPARRPRRGAAREGARRPRSRDRRHPGPASRRRRPGPQRPLPHLRRTRHRGDQRRGHRRHAVPAGRSRHRSR